MIVPHATSSDFMANDTAKDALWRIARDQRSPSPIRLSLLDTISKRSIYSTMYDTDTSLQTFVQDFGLDTNIEYLSKVIGGWDNFHPVYGDKYNIFATLDKLGLTAILDKLVAAPQSRSPDLSTMSTAIINTTLTNYHAVDASINGFNIVFNNTLSDMHIQSKKVKKYIANARKRGFYISKIKDPQPVITNDYLELYTAPTLVKELTITKKSPISIAPFAKSLRKLSISSYCDITRDLYDNLQLCDSIEELTIRGYDHPSNNYGQLPPVLFWRTLSILDARYSSMITSDALSLCNAITKLDAFNNDGIVTCEPFALTLRKLDAGYRCGITDEGLKKCCNLEKLNVVGNLLITTCDSFCNSLKILHANNSMITDDSLKLCIHIENLNAYDNPRITTCKPFSRTLHTLDASRNCGICDAGLAQCKNIRILCMSHNCRISTCAPFAKSLIKLDAATYSDKSKEFRMGDDGLLLCNKIQRLDVAGNPHVTNCNSFALSLRHLYTTAGSGITIEGLQLCSDAIKSSFIDMKAHYYDCYW